MHALDLSIEAVEGVRSFSFARETTVLCVSS